MATIKIHNPSAPDVKSNNAISPFPAIRESRAGVLENTKQHAELVMTEVVRQLGDRYGVIHAATGHKKVAAAASPETIADLVRACDWVIVGSAD